MKILDEDCTFSEMMVALESEIASASKLDENEFKILVSPKFQDAFERKGFDMERDAGKPFGKAADLTPFEAEFSEKIQVEIQEVDYDGPELIVMAVPTGMISAYEEDKKSSE